MAPGQRESGGWIQGGVVPAAAVGAAAIAGVVRHPVPQLLRDVAEGALLHLDAARAVSERERGGAQLEGSRAAAARVRRGNGRRRVRVAT